MKLTAGNSNYLRPLSRQARIYTIGNPSLQHLTKLGLIESGPMLDGWKKKYAITPAGRAALEQEGK